MKMEIRKNLPATALTVIILSATVLAGCRQKEEPAGPKEEKGGQSEKGPVAGFFLLNEGNYGTNKCTLDYYDYASGTYSRNIFPSRNPDIALGLGDMGNDLKIHGDKLYAAVNVSGIVEVMDIRTARHLAAIDIPQCRYITFSEGYAFVSSYSGPVEQATGRQRGYVAKIDTASFKILDTCVVGYQPEEMAVVGDKLYVANSGGYNAPDYDKTITVIDLKSFTKKNTIEVAVNLNRIEKDSDDCLWVASRGDYSQTPSRLYLINTSNDCVEKEFADIPCSSMAVNGDSLYIQSSQWNSSAMKMENSFSIVNTKSRTLVKSSIITDGTTVTSPYGIAVNPTTGDILIPDAGDYVSPGTLHCFSSDGVHKWSVTTGDIPGHIAFTRVALE